MTNYCDCNDFKKAVDYNDIRYYRTEDDRFNEVGVRSWAYDGRIASLEPFRHCPWCSKKLANPKL